MATSLATRRSTSAVAFPDNQMQVLPYNRTVKDLSGRSPEQFLDTLREVVTVSDGQPTPTRKGEASMYLAGKWYRLDLGRVAHRPLHHLTSGRVEGMHGQELAAGLIDLHGQLHIITLTIACLKKY